MPAGNGPAGGHCENLGSGAMSPAELARPGREPRLQPVLAVELLGS